ncbi:serine/threonine-protein kinase SBK1-like [Eleutherodactylus coqui]|uniref:serine/threonine-protein kinase SBK1-like n=1 Tax=Eleutherodactylus coqui TaxID=57060 RepID=UPI00346373F0
MEPFEVSLSNDECSIFNFAEQIFEDTMASSTQDVQLILEGLVFLASQCLKEIDLQENFCVIQKLGDGGYGSVLMVQDRKTDQKMALKLLNRNKTTEFAFLMEFSKSFFLSSHTNIIGSYGTAFKTWDYFAFAQELSIGDLFSLITPHDGLPEDTVKRCAVQISSALEFIDSKGLVHLDIKPENILVFDEDCHSIKMTDFGLSCIKGTMAKTRIGTVSYMAPEMSQVTDKDCLLVDFPLDVWSFGIVLYCLLTGEFPWQSAVSTDKAYSSFVEWQCNMKNIEPPSPWSRFPPGSLKMFSGLLAIDCSKRRKSYEVLLFLEECWNQESIDSSEGTSDDADTTNVSVEFELSKCHQKSDIWKDAHASPLSNVSYGSISSTSLLSTISGYLTSDSSEYDSKTPLEDWKDG